MSYNVNMDLKKWTIFSLLDDEFRTNIKMACVFGNLGNEALMVTKDDEVYAIGSNASGCLGLGDLKGSLYPKKVELLCNKSVKGFAYGSGPHVLAYTENGELYSWGHNGYFELGCGSSNICLHPTQITGSLLGHHVIDVACGSHHSLTLTKEGEVFAWGHNNCGQVGSGISNNQNCPRKVSSGIHGRKVVAIACGQTSSMVVLDSGEVYGWGYNGNGQLGLGNTMNQMNPTKITHLSEVAIIKIVCGYAHTMALSDCGDLYVWGANSYGQLGMGNKSNINIPTRVASDLGRIVDVAATHYNHISAAMTQNFNVYMWGQCRGQSITVPTATPFVCLHDVFACFAIPSVMWKPAVVDLDEGEKITDSLKAAFDDPNSSDLIISVEERPIHVHKAVLKIRCQHFQSMFKDNCWQECSMSVIEIDQYSYCVYKAFLQYLYTDEINLEPEKALELLDLANAYCEIHLKKKCERLIIQGITKENAAKFYATAITYEAVELEEFCFRFILNHMTDVVKSDGFAALNDQIVKNFIRQAADAGAFKS